MQFNDISITKQHNNLLLSIPLTQDAHDYSGQKAGKVSNLVGVITENETTISYAIDMTYKGKDIQIGDTFLNLHTTKENFIQLCKSLSIPFFIYPSCHYCQKPLYSTFTIDKNGKNCHQECEP